ncbi:RNA polymerase sigma factor [Streptomyces sp. NPDC004267]|uniref:RNA polymerase sigma factor n=1 Tax=Streptomyces sp. NPDC004267 TaxID=3364694 RepID=UPI0036A19406
MSVQPSLTHVEQRLLDCYPMFMATEPLVLRRKYDPLLSQAACEDIAQEAYDKVAAKAASGELDSVTKLPGYLRTASRNLAKDALRALRRDLVRYDSELVATVPPPRVSADDADLLERLVVPLIDAMPRTQRRKIVQLQSQGLEDADIASVLGIDKIRLRKDRSYAVIELRGKLGKHIRDGHRKQTRRVEKDG